MGRLNSKKFYFLVWGLTLCLSIVGLLSVFMTSSGDVKGEQISREVRNDQAKATSSHILAVIVPFRERFEELMEFVPYMNHFLTVKDIRHEIIIVNQLDDYRFNRASLINVGYLFAKNVSGSDYIAIHDVDLLPLNYELDYSYPAKGPYHVASPDLHPRYHYKTFVGGILLLSNTDFEKVDGLSNRYWGWGLEDDEFYVRMKNAGLKIQRPKNLATNITNTFRHIHGRKRKRDSQRCFDQKKEYKQWDLVSGLHDVSFRILSQFPLKVKDSSATVLNVQLSCNRTRTPWCICP